MSAEYPLVDKLQELKKKYLNLSEQLSDPEVMGDMKKFIQLNKEYRELEPIVAAADKYCKMVQDLEGAKEILLNEKDEDLRDLAKEELSAIESEIPGMEEEIKLLLSAMNITPGKYDSKKLRYGKLAICTDADRI